ENNGYAISVPLSKESAVTDVAERAAGYGLPGSIANGNDVLDVYEAMHAAVSRARSGAGATLIECKTYRYLAHTSDDDDRSYRSLDEIEMWKRRDPIALLKRYLIEQRMLPEAVEASITSQVNEIVEDATSRAEAAPPALPAEAFERVWAQPIGRSLHREPSQIPDDSAAPGTGQQINVIEAVRGAISKALDSDERVMILGEDVGKKGGVFGATKGLVDEFGEDRVLDTPLAESSIVGIAIGLAFAGKLPIAEIQFADFIHSAFDQIVSEAARMYYRSNGDFSMPLVIRAPWGGGIHGALYHSQCIEAFYAHVPGLKVVAPSTPADVAGLLASAVEDPDPVLFLEHKKTYRSVKGIVPPGDWRVPIGVAEVVRDGTDLSVITYGMHRHLAVAAADELSPQASLEVIDLRTISPLDTEAIIASVVKCGRVLIVHEDSVSFGVGAEVAALIADEAFWDLDAPIRRLAMPDIPAMPYAGSLEAAVAVGADDIVLAAKQLLGI
ncbi:MAG TPA: thiamine pyrophosphate-dependent enzyme, partial [Acidimicrobiales bacterium]|nr:thiamine pyrophosphate-dependent enzyme [Acidimicrobiales bacterium]